MRTKRTLLVAAMVSVIVLAAPLADAVDFRPLIVIDPAGTVRIQQALPCGDPLDIVRLIAGGRIDITPTSIPGDVFNPITLHLSRLEIFLSPFSVHRECGGIAATVEFFQIGLRLANVVSVPAENVGDGQLRFTIPKDQFLIYASVLDNRKPLTRPERAYKKPIEDVTGLINGREGTVELHVSLSSQLHIRAGCVHNRCAIDQVLDGTQTANVLGRFLVPGADTDGDGVPDLTDNCPRVRNPTQSPVATPILTPPPDVTLHSCRDHDIGTAHAEDVCHGRPVVITNDAPAAFAVGANTVLWRGNDGIDPIVTARQTVTIDEVDRTPPTVSCTAVTPPPGEGFRVAAADDCGGRLTVQLGAYTLGNGEVIQLEETGQAGVRLIGTIAGGIRHFQAGKGDAVVQATDAAGNVARAICR